MKSLALLTLLGTALASPLASRAEVKSMMAATAEWTIESMVRTCNSKDTKCTWSFTVNTNVAGVDSTPCTMVVLATDANTPASESNGGPVTCGVFTVTSGWSGYFGAGNGFTVLSVVDYAAGLIVWPSYTDKQLVNGQVVVPDQSYQPQSLS